MTPAGGAFGTFDQVECARRRISELSQASHSHPQADTAADPSTRAASHAWCLWVTPQPAQAALLVCGEWSLAAFVLQGFFSRVDLWETDAHRAEVIAQIVHEAGLAITVQHCPPAELTERLATAGEAYGLAAMQEVLGLIPRHAQASRRELLRALAAATSADGQCCVIGSNRCVRGRAGARNTSYAPPTPAEVRRAWRHASNASVETLFFHPDHHNPAEILFPPERLPKARRAQFLPHILARCGLVEHMLGSFACFRPLARGSLLVDEAANRWQQDRGGPTALARIGDCTIRENAMTFVTIESTDGDEAIVRLPLHREAAEVLQRLDAAYDGTARTVPQLQRLIPESQPLLSIYGWPVHIECRCKGQPVRTLIADPASRAGVRRQMLALVNDLCEATLERRIVDETFCETHFGTRFRSLHATEPGLADDLRQVEGQAIASIVGKLFPTVRIHGDLTVNNVFADPVDRTLTGIIDWETSLAGSLPFDLIHYLISERRESDPQPWGVQVARLLAGELLDPEAEALLNAHLEFLQIPREQLAPLLVGYWIRGVALRQGLSGGRLVPAWRDRNLAGPLAKIKQVLLRSA